MSKKILGHYSHRGYIPYKEDFVEGSFANAEVNSLKAQGELCIFNLYCSEPVLTGEKLSFLVPYGFCPVEDTEVIATCEYFEPYAGFKESHILLTIPTDGFVEIDGTNWLIRNFKIANAGWIRKVE